jgi:hypothetical protein
MTQVLSRHWPAIGVLALTLLRSWRGELELSWELGLLGIAFLGLVMNLAVILLNGGMPVTMPEDEIPEEEKPFYHSLGPQTRLPLLADWIDVGWAYYSPGDFLIDFGAVGMLILLGVRLFLG